MQVWKTVHTRQVPIKLDCISALYFLIRWSLFTKQKDRFTQSIDDRNKITKGKDTRTSQINKETFAEKMIN